MFIGVHGIKDVPKEMVCVCEKNRQEKERGLQATAQTLLIQSLCYRQGRAHSRRDAGSVV